MTYTINGVTKYGAPTLEPLNSSMFLTLAKNIALASGMDLETYLASMSSSADGITYSNTSRTDLTNVKLALDYLLGAFGSFTQSFALNSVMYLSSSTEDTFTTVTEAQMTADFGLSIFSDSRPIYAIMYYVETDSTGKYKVSSYWTDNIVSSTNTSQTKTVIMTFENYVVKLRRAGTSSTGYTYYVYYKSVANGTTVNTSGFENIIRDYNEVTSLASLPTDKYYIKATLASAPSSISFKASSLPTDGSEYTISIYNSSSTAYTFLLPSTGGWQSDATTISIPAGKVTELSVRCYEYNSSMIYVIKA